MEHGVVSENIHAPSPLPNGGHFCFRPLPSWNFQEHYWALLFRPYNHKPYQVSLLVRTSSSSSSSSLHNNNVIFFLFTKFFLLGRRQGSIHHCCRINLWNLSIGNVYLFFSVRISCKYFPILIHGTDNKGQVNYKITLPVGSI